MTGFPVTIFFPDNLFRHSLAPDFAMAKPVLSLSVFLKIECKKIDKNSLFWWHGHPSIETDLLNLFHGGNVSKGGRDVQSEGYP